MRGLEQYKNLPLKLVVNRAERTYRGGRLLEEWLDIENPEDSYYPEDWIASTVTSLHQGKRGGTEGQSRVLLPDGSMAYLRDLIAAAPADYLGEAHYRRFGIDLAVLIKALDSAERLIVQVHPDPENALRFFGSQYGKTECWYILNHRQINGEDPYVLMGFKEGVTKEKWKRLIDMQDSQALADCLNRFPAETGSVILIEGGVPHAIGPGCFVLEIQEPTDYTMRVERVSPGGLEISDYSMHMNLGFDNMLELFHYDCYTMQKATDTFIIKPRVLEQASNRTHTRLIGYEDTHCFRMDSLKVNTETSLKFEGGCSVFIVTEGSGVIRAGGRDISVGRGEKLFLPAALSRARVKSTGEMPLNMVWCFPPKIE